MKLGGYHHLRKDPYMPCVPKFPALFDICLTIRVVYIFLALVQVVCSFCQKSSNS